MANIIPQVPNVNHRTQIKAEKLERKVASKLGTINVLNGVVYSSSPKRIGKNKIAVPQTFLENDLSVIAKGDKLKNHIVDCNTTK